MAIVHESSATAASATCTKPTGTASGDLLVAVVFGVGNGTFASLAGWTQRATIANSGFYTITILTKGAGGSEPADYTFTGPAAVDAVGISRFSGANTTTLDGTATTSNTATVGSITTTAANSWLVMAGMASDTITPDAAMTERWEQAGGVFGTFGNLATEARPSSGATGTRTITASPLNTAMIAIREAAAGTDANSTATKGTVTVTGKLATSTAIRNPSSTTTKGTVTATGKTATGIGQRNASSTTTKATVTATGKTATAIGGSDATSTATKGTVTATGLTATGIGQRNTSSTSTSAVVTVTGYDATAAAESGAISETTAGTATAFGYLATAFGEQHPASTATIGTVLAVGYSAFAGIEKDRGSFAGGRATVGAPRSGPRGTVTLEQPLRGTVGGTSPRIRGVVS